ncbi:MAG TPA: copper homeostasis membrane protein CopD [Stellaceae bacterium]|nr:copper homeostasis membrane protein CopD [Stellaceae bacterium]
MQGFLIAARTLHYAATISLTGIFAFECLVGGPAIRRSGLSPANAGGLRRRLHWLAWASLALAVASGAAWLIAISSEMSGKPLAVALSQGAVTTVLIRTRFGEDWLLRLFFALLCALCLFTARLHHTRPRRALGWAALLFSVLLLAGLAWAGHGAATPGWPGELHLAADLLHLLAAGVWLGMLLPLALLLAEARLAGEVQWAAAAQLATLRFSALAVGSTAMLLASGIVNTWFLAGTVPALVGTEYGRLLLGKIALFLVILLIAAVNLLRLTPRLTGEAGSWRWAAAHLRRNALLEATIGLAVLAIVGALGVLPPGLHTQPRWPFPFRLDIGALSVGWQVLLAILGAAFCGCTAAAVVSAAAGHYGRVPPLAAAVLLCGAIGWIALRAAIERAYPTSFYAPAEPYAAPSVAHGAAVYAENCVLCHGATGRGDGPAAASLPIRPANLTEPHLFAHSPGDLFWWVSDGKGNGVMPGFGGVLNASQRWDVINFIRARAAGVLAGAIGPEVTTTAAPEVPDFAFVADGAQQTLGQTLATGPVLLVLYARPPPTERLQQLAAAQPRLGAAGLRVIAAELSSSAEESPEATRAIPFAIALSPEAGAVLKLFRATDDGGETELMLDRAANIRARWTSNMPGGLAPPGALATDAQRVAEIAVAAPSHAGHAH